jgi:hypothetical protein
MIRRLRLRLSLQAGHSREHHDCTDECDQRVSLDLFSPIEGASFLINAYCCLDSVVVVANNSLIRFERFRKSHDTGGRGTFSAALSPVGRSLPLKSASNRVTEAGGGGYIRRETLASILK